MKNLFILLIILSAYFSSAQQTHWAINNSTVDYQNNSTSPLPNGVTPDHAQNSLVNNQGQLEFYVADGQVYDASGGLLHSMLNPEDGLTPSPGFSEVLISPVPGACDAYYVITTFSNGGELSGNFLVYSRLQKINNAWVAQTMPNGSLIEYYQNSNCSFFRSDPPLDPETPENPFYHNHLALTKTNNAGNRYLFMSIPKCIGIFEVTASDIQYIGNTGSDSQWISFQRNNRSEMEVFEYESTDNKEFYSVATSYFGNSTSNNAGGAAHIFDFSFTNGLPNLDQEYQLVIPKPTSTIGFSQCVNGLEFSEDGLTLYASIAYYNSLPVFANSNNVVFFERQSINNLFTYSGVLLTGEPTQDFGFGQIERGLDSKLYFAGNNRLGTLQDNNDPASVFIPNALSVNNVLTKGKEYIDPNDYPSMVQMWLYTLPDQIDGEDYSAWKYGPPNNFPDVITNCDFPFYLNLSSISYVQLNDLANPVNSILMHSNQITVNSESQIIISDYSDFACAETLEVSCCPESGTEVFCAPAITHSFTVDPITGVGTLCSATCTTDVPAACSYYWHFNYIDDNGLVQTVTSNNPTFCKTFTATESETFSITVHLQKILCYPSLECGEEIVIDLSYHIINGNP